MADRWGYRITPEGSDLVETVYGTGYRGPDILGVILDILDFRSTHIFSPREIARESRGSLDTDEITTGLRKLQRAEFVSYEGD